MDLRYCFHYWAPGRATSTQQEREEELFGQASRLCPFPSPSVSLVCVRGGTGIEF